MKATILLAEDEQAMREVLTDYFTAKSGGDLRLWLRRTATRRCT